MISDKQFEELDRKIDETHDTVLQVKTIVERALPCSLHTSQIEDLYKKASWATNKINMALGAICLLALAVSIYDILKK
jgi:hypothetical protein